MENSEQREQSNEFEAVKARLEEIANTVDDENLSLDEALDLYEEAVKLGLQASDLLETGIVIEEAEAQAEAESPAEGDGDVAQAPDSPQADNGGAPADSTANES